MSASSDLKLLFSPSACHFHFDASDWVNLKKLSVTTFLRDMNQKHWCFLLWFPPQWLPNAQISAAQERLHFIFSSSPWSSTRGEAGLKGSNCLKSTHLLKDASHLSSESRWRRWRWSAAAETVISTDRWLKKALATSKNIHPSISCTLSSFRVSRQAQVHLQVSLTQRCLTKSPQPSIKDRSNPFICPLCAAASSRSNNKAKASNA